MGFGISTAKQVEQVGEFADGVVVGSAICKALDAATAKVTAAASVEAFIKTLTATPGDRSKRRKISQAAAIAAQVGTEPFSQIAERISHSAH